MSLVIGDHSSGSLDLFDEEEVTEGGEEEEEEEEGGDWKSSKNLHLGPQVPLKHQLEKDKGDESLRRWKEQLLGNVDMNSVGEHLEAEVKILSLSILSPGRPDIVLKLPEATTKGKGPWFTLKEGSHYRVKFSFIVRNNIVSGLRFTNTIWKAGIKVDSKKAMLGTFSPQLQPYVCEMPEEITPSGIFVRGSYSARSRNDFTQMVLYHMLQTLQTCPDICQPRLAGHISALTLADHSKLVDDDNKRYLETNYTFDIRKEWAHLSH